LTDAATGVPLLRNEEKTRALRQTEEKAAASEERIRALEEELARR
jgi:hypothetical protein